MTEIVDVNVAALADEVEAEQKRRRLLEQRGPVDRPQGCVYCGVTVERDLFDGVHWSPSGECARCRLDRLGRSDRENRLAMLRKVLAADDELRFWHPEQAAERVGGFPWFCEVKGAEPSPDRRFAYLAAVLPDIVAALKPSNPDPVYESGPACPVCGSKDRWCRIEEVTTVYRSEAALDAQFGGGSPFGSPDPDRKIAVPSEIKQTRCRCGWRRGAEKPDTGREGEQVTLANGQTGTKVTKKESGRYVPKVYAADRVARRAQAIAGLKREPHGAQLADALGLAIFQDARAADPQLSAGEPWHWWPPAYVIRARAGEMFRASMFVTPAAAERAANARADEARRLMDGVSR